MPLFRRVQLLTILLLLTGSVRGAAQQGVVTNTCEADAFRRGVCAVDDSLGIALIRADTAALRRFYADDLVSINYRGVRSTKAMLLSVIGARRLRFDTLDVVQRDVRVSGDTALVRERMHQVATGAEGRHPLDVNYRRTYVRRGGRWQLAAATISLASP